MNMTSEERTRHIQEVHDANIRFLKDCPANRMITNEEYRKFAQAEWEPLDDELKAILGKRYENMSDYFAPEAQQKRRNHRLRVTLAAAATMISTIIFSVWAIEIGLFSMAVGAGCIAVAGAVTGYNIGICICHNHGCWGPMV